MKKSSSVRRAIRTGLTACVIGAGALTTQADELVKVWDKSIGGTGTEFLTDAVELKDGSIIATGISWSKIGADKTLDLYSRYGDAEEWTVRLGSDSSLKWQGRHFSGSGGRVFPAEDGGYLIARTIEEEGQRNYFNVSKYDVNNVVEWQSSFIGNGGVPGASLATIAVDTDGNYILAGSSGYDAGNDKSENGHGDMDYWIIKIDGNGNKIWDKTIGAAKEDSLQGLVVTSDGYIAGGYTRSGKSGDKTSAGFGEIDSWVVKLDKDGNILWDKTFGGSETDTLLDMSPAENGGCYALATSYSPASGNKSEDSLGGDYWIIKIDTDGNKVWDKTVGGDTWEYASSIMTLSDGGCFVGGRSNSAPSGNKTAALKGDYDVWLARLDKDGALAGNWSFGGEGEEYLKSLYQMKDGSILVGAASASEQGGDRTEPRRGYRDYWVLKLTFDYKGKGLPTPGTIISLKSLTTDSYVTINGWNNRLMADAPTVTNSEKYLVTDAGSGYVAFRSIANGNYIGIENLTKGFLRASKPASKGIGNWQRFKLADVENGYISFFPKPSELDFVRANGGHSRGRIDSQGEPVAENTQFEWDFAQQTFPPTGAKIWIRTGTNGYVGVNPTTKKVYSNASSVTEAEAWELFKGYDNYFGLKSVSTGQFLILENTTPGTFKATGKQEQVWSKFTIKAQKDGTFNIKPKPTTTAYVTGSQTTGRLESTGTAGTLPTSFMWGFVE